MTGGSAAASKVRNKPQGQDQNRKEEVRKLEAQAISQE
jgi:hypothetical protein